MNTMNVFHQVFVVKDTVLALQPVEVLQFQEDDALVRGLPDGTSLVTTNVAGAYEGMVVKVKQH